MPTSSSITDKMFNEIVKKVGKGGTLLEFGSGSSTPRFADAGLTVITVEHDANWLKEIPGVMQIYAPQGLDDWYDISDDDWELIPKKLDAVLVDGPPMMHKLVKQGRLARFGILKHLDKIDNSATFYVDDAHRPADRSLAKELSRRLNRKGRVRFSKGKGYMVI